MTEERTQRRLAAILAADIVGYSRLMEVDESGTLAALKARRREVLNPLVTKHQGRIFKMTGDGVLVEFGSAVNAVQCAVDLQQGMAMANRGQPEDRQIVLRIGVNLGDVMVEGSDLYGDGINVAARLENLADPGGICLSAMVHQNVKTKLDLAFEDLGEQRFKNIAEPVRAYRVTGTQAVTVAAPELVTDKPSIAVLPFTNMSGDPEQEYFSDGITEDIITELSRFRSLFVIARNSSFQYKGKNVDVRRVARELGVKYVVEGSVRKMANRVRITAQLIDTASGNHLWSERYDRALEEIFAVQDEVLHSIVAQLEGRLASSMAEQARRKPTEFLAAYDCVLQARQYLSTYAWEAAEPLLRRAVDLDPNYTQAYAYLAWAVLIHYFFDARTELLDGSLQLARKAVALDSNDAVCHTALGFAYTFRREYDEAGASLTRAFALNPSDAFVITGHAHWLSRVGRYQESLAILDLALQRDPFPPSWYWEGRSIALVGLKRYEQAIQSLKSQDRLFYWSYANLAACFAHLGRMDEARTAAATVVQMQPDFTIRILMLQEPWKNPADSEHEVEGLRKAGLPE
ncbi:MAG: adenylate/guanylate cyclase domain-containing protein [Dongiaceae bacterium]